MNLLHLQKNRIDSVETECSRLHSLVVSQCMDSLSFASNNHGTECSNQARIIDTETVYQNQVPMEIEGASPPHSGKGQEEQGSVHI